MTGFEHVLALVRRALWGEEIHSGGWSDEEWGEIYRIASAQGVLPIIFDSFSSECVPPEAILSRWTLDVIRYESAADRINDAIEDLTARLERNGIEFAILKGVNIAKHYPHPRHRITGDIDFYFPSGDGFTAADRMARSLSDVSRDSDGDIHYVWRGVVVEHHRGWNHLSTKAAAGIQPRIRNHALQPEDDLLMLSSHLLRHAMIGGAGLRQLADVAVATRSYQGQYDKAEFAGTLTGLSLGKWAGLLAAVMNSVFGIPVDELPAEPDKTHLEEFLSLVISDGNLGKSNVRMSSNFFKRFRLFIRVCPKEYSARWFSLISGRIVRVLKGRNQKPSENQAQRV